MGKILPCCAASTYAIAAREPVQVLTVSCTNIDNSFIVMLVSIKLRGEFPENGSAEQVVCQRIVNLSSFSQHCFHFKSRLVNFFLKSRIFLKRTIIDSPFFPTVNEIMLPKLSLQNDTYFALLHILMFTPEITFPFVRTLLYAHNIYAVQATSGKCKVSEI